MNQIIETVTQPWPWYVAGPIIGLCVPALLWAGNKALGISSTLRQVCAMCLPANIPFLKYNWRSQIWNLFFAFGLLLGGFIGGFLLNDHQPTAISNSTITDLQNLGITHQSGLVPDEIFSWTSFYLWPNCIIVLGGAFLIGFGTRWAGGCTSGHAIMGLSNLQLPSLIATCCFMAGGFIMTWLILPFLLNL